MIHAAFFEHYQDVLRHGYRWLDLHDALCDGLCDVTVRRVYPNMSVPVAGQAMAYRDDHG